MWDSSLIPCNWIIYKSQGSPSLSFRKCFKIFNKRTYKSFSTTGIEWSFLKKKIKSIKKRVWTGFAWVTLKRILKNKLVIGLPREGEGDECHVLGCQLPQVAYYGPQHQLTSPLPMVKAPFQTKLVQSIWLVIQTQERLFPDHHREKSTW